MKYTHTNTLLFFISLPLTSAIPTRFYLPIPATNTCPPHTGTPGAFYMCRELDFAGSCEYVPPNGLCMSWPEDSAMSRIRSFGPDAGAVCDFYKGPHCAGEVVQSIECPGFRDLADWGWFGSLKCRVK